MSKNIVISTILFIGILIFSFIILGQIKNVDQTKIDHSIVEENQEVNISTPASIILFYGDGCPHCEIVEKYVAENDIETKVSFIKKEVYYNKQNSDELVAKAQACGLPINSIGVPFLWDGSKCFVGDKDIIEFLKTKNNQQ